MADRRASAIGYDVRAIARAFPAVFRFVRQRIGLWRMGIDRVGAAVEDEESVVIRHAYAVSYDVRAQALADEVPT